MTDHYLYVYGKKHGPFKVGFTKNLKLRTTNIRCGRRSGHIDLGGKRGVMRYKEVAADNNGDARLAEKLAHRLLANFRIERPRSSAAEWFECDVDTAIWAVDRAVAAVKNLLAPKRGKPRK